MPADSNSRQSWQLGYEVAMKTASTRPLRACFPLYSVSLFWPLWAMFSIGGIVNAVLDPHPAACREASGACWGL